MAKLPSITPKILIKILESSDFKIDHSTGSHYIFYNSKTKRRAVVPFHAKDLPKGTIISILKEAGITKQELENFLK
jgi:predicted RNA binding protein YcfA (HicA-like mRNA interferase family)